MSKLIPLLGWLSVVITACAIGIDDDVATNERPYGEGAYDASVADGEAAGVDASPDASVADVLDAVVGDDANEDTESEGGEEDAGCTPFDIEELGPCGHCGSEERECQEDGTWGETECKEVGSCTPGTIDSQPCGACGTRTRACTNGCQWEPWSPCEGQGICMPGEVKAAPSPECDDRCTMQTRTCTDSCEWGACDLKPTSACEWKGGTHWRCCGTGMFQYCLPSTCDWSKECVACTGNIKCMNECL